MPRDKETPEPYQKIPIPGFHSDYLYTKWFVELLSVLHVPASSRRHTRS
jgi:hypothetical protein